MGEYFKPWRRKFGVLTLLVACVFAAGWVRSLQIADILQVRLDTNVQSFGGYVVLATSWPTFQTENPVRRYPIWITVAVRDCWLTVTNDNLGPWAFDAFGFRMRTQLHQIGAAVRYYMVPYWSIVLPLTVLSAYLLLSKPRNTVKVPA